MAQHRDSHLIGDEVERLRQMTQQQAERAFGDRVARSFLDQPPAGDAVEFAQQLDFNAHLVTACRQRGVVWLKAT